MHDKGFSHRYIKPENNLLDKDLNIKVANFGFTICSNILKTNKGTIAYMALEFNERK
jgi:serine/threonine protein kinase